MKKRILRMIAFILFILILLLIIGGISLYQNGFWGRAYNSKPKDGQIKVACVGDSITYGHGISDWAKNNYPAVLQEILGDDFHVANFGSSGSCVNPNGDQPYIERDVYKESLEYEPDILVIMLGTNDSKPENWVDEKNFWKEYMELVYTYADREYSPMVFLCTCSEAYFVGGDSSELANFDIQPSIVDDIAQIIKQDAPLSSSIFLNVIDIHSLTEQNSEWFKEDGIHPNEDGARGIAEAIAEEIKLRITTVW